ncbi:MAG: class I adenylate-forming enzyme family protein [Marinibacterium sp.]
MLSVFDTGGFAPCPAPFNLAAHVLGATARQPDKNALSILHGTTTENWSFADLAAAVRGTGTGLLRAGLCPGDRVLMRLGNSVEFPVAYLGAIAAGLIPVPTSPQLTGTETARIVRDLAPRAILHAPGIATAPGAPVIPLADLRAMYALPACDVHMGDPDRLAYVIYTSGTSGQPRAVGHAHRAIWARQMMIRDWYGLTARDRVLHAGAFNWTFTLGTGLMDPWTVGATALIPGPDTRPGDLAALLARHGATIFAAVPGIYRKILQQPDLPDLPDLRHGLSAGEKLSDPLRKAWGDATGTDILEAFGMSECSTFLSARPGAPATAGSLGRPQTGRRVAILGDDGLPVPVGEPGTIAIGAEDPGLMLGYLDAPDATAARYAGDWFLTGDRGAMRADFQVRYLGRADDMMNAGGFRVSPVEVENALSRHAGIDHVAVTEVRVRQDASIIVAFYTAATALEETDLRAFAARHLAGYKQPRAYVRLSALPTGTNGKILRRALPEFFDARYEPEQS